MCVPDVRDVVELRYESMPSIRTQEPIRFKRLWTSMPQYKHGRSVGADQERADEQLKVVHGLDVPGVEEFRSRS